MAIALESANRVWQKAKPYLDAATPAAKEALLQVKIYLATQARNPDLQFIPFSAEQIVTNGGYSPDVDACTLYVLYLKGRRTSGTTSSFVSVHAATDNSATTTTIWTARFKAAGQAAFFASGAGIAVETELTVAAATAVGGATESSAADAADGFAIVGA